MASILDHARWYTSHGISVIPVKADGSKSPLHSGWRKYSTELPDDDTLTKWFGDPKQVVGIGAVPGPASGNMVVMDFECVGGSSAYLHFLPKLSDDLLTVVNSIPTVRTPSGGRHLWVRLPEPQPGGKLARYDNGKTKIEIRGEGHQVLAPGCPAECHRTRGVYEWERMPAEYRESEDAFPMLEMDTWAELCAVAAQCNEYMPPEQSRDHEASSTGGAPAGVDSPGNDFNARGSWADTGLFDAGWHWHHEVGSDRGFLTRPGKESGISASVGMVSSKAAGYPYLYVWSTSVPNFAAETPYSRFAVYTVLKHAGDYSAAAKELARQGYGERRDGLRHGEVDLSQFTLKPAAGSNAEPIRPFADDKPTDPAAEGPKEDKPFKWMSELSATQEDCKWVWEGYLRKGGITLMSALWKAGKSTLLSHLLKSLNGSETHFLGQAVTPGRVLYITEEDESIWADRRDDLLIGDHVGMICRPFTSRPTIVDYRRFLAEKIIPSIRKYQFDLVIVDTLAKMWPVREENDAGQVDEGMMPIWDIAKEGPAVLLVHHSRKSGGEQFVGARGSGALPAFCEILLEFDRETPDTKNPRRVIKAIGRYKEIPDKRLIELTPCGYVSHGDPDDSEVRASTKAFPWEDALRSVLVIAEADWLTFGEIEAGMRAENGTAPDRKDLRAVLDRMFDGGEIERDGEGKKGSPYRYRLVQMGGGQPQDTGTPETDAE